MHVRLPEPDTEQDLFGEGSHEHDKAIDFSDSDSEDSRDDEHAFEEQKLNEVAMDHVVGPWNEHATLEALGLQEDAPLFRNRFTRQRRGATSFDVAERSIANMKNLMSGLDSCLRSVAKALEM